MSPLPDSQPGIGEALTAWRALMGDDRVVVDPPTLAGYGTATFSTSASVAAVLQPGDADEVARCLGIAVEQNVPLYPISRGKNWGLGSRVPTEDGCVVLDLGRLDRIVDFNEELAYVTVEPGVTFQRLHAFLRDRGSDLFHAVTGGPPDGSLVGNALERGDGAGPLGDRALHACAMEVVLPTGEMVRTGYSRFVGARCAALSRNGVGPGLHGLFTQSNLGVVTRMTFWLHPRPAEIRVLQGSVPNGAELGSLVDAVRRLTLEGTLFPHCTSLWNSYRTLTRAGRYPWRRMDGRTPLRLDEVAGGSPWYASLALYSPSQLQAHAAEARVREVLGSVADSFVTARGPEALEQAGSSQILGAPSRQNLTSLYWRKKHGPVGIPDPERDGCGILWLCPELPLEGGAVVEAVNLCESVVLDHGFEPVLGGIVPSGRSLRVFVSILYDREVTGEDERALACHDALLGRLVDRGFLPYRLGVQSMGALPKSGPWDQVLTRIKGVLDPAGVLAPGRYTRSPDS